MVDSTLRFSGYVLAAPILVTAAELPAIPPAAAAPPSSDVTRLLGLDDVRTATALPASRLISVEVCQDGTVSVALHRARMSRHVATAAAGLIAQELCVPRARVHVSLVDARPDPISDECPHTAESTCVSIRIAAALARQRLLAAASAAFGSPVTDLRLTAGVITDDADRRSDIGALARRAASRSTIAVTVELVVPRAADLTVVGHPPTASPPETG
ncbi:molybdopterin cofactor-binding domain-containing protein [Melissospora conviva]|uniref:molybdopterin cofactor-binding domain-containing protein n=1 Tax=Melissospora conviva TaxID=3388432 RepID=UPI003C13A8C9